MSDMRPSPDWWQASDGRWYPPELRPGQRLIRNETGATILVRTDGVTPPEAPVEDRTERRGSHQGIRGPIEAHVALDLGRPAGLQNRPAAWLALGGSALMLIGARMPWAVRDIAAAGSTDLGWRDAGGELAGGFYAMLLAVTVMTVSVRCMAGSYSRGWRAALVALASGGIALAGAEAIRIHRAIEEVAHLARDNASLSFGPGLVILVVGAGLVLVAAGAYRVGRPD